MIKRFLAGLLCLTMALPALAEEPDEQDIALTEDMEAVIELSVDADTVYATSDVTGDGEEDRVIDPGEVPEFVELLLDTARAGGEDDATVVTVRLKRV